MSRKVQEYKVASNEMKLQFETVQRELLTTQIELNTYRNELANAKTETYKLRRVIMKIRELLGELTDRELTLRNLIPEQPPLETENAEENAVMRLATLQPRVRYQKPTPEGDADNLLQTICEDSFGELGVSGTSFIDSLTSIVSEVEATFDQHHDTAIMKPASTIKHHCQSGHATMSSEATVVQELRSGQHQSNLMEITMESESAALPDVTFHGTALITSTPQVPIRKHSSIIQNVLDEENLPKMKTYIVKVNRYVPNASEIEAFKKLMEIAENESESSSEVESVASTPEKKTRKRTKKEPRRNSGRNRRGKYVIGSLAEKSLITKMRRSK